MKPFRRGRANPDVFRERFDATIDTTVRPKAIAHPIDSRLYLTALPTLMDQAKKTGVMLRQSHACLVKRAAIKAGRCQAIRAARTRGRVHQQGLMGSLWAHKRYEFGCKVGIAATNREGLFIAAMAFEGNPYDGHTLKTTAAKTEEMAGGAIQRLYADKGYRGHDHDGGAKVMISGNRRGLTPTMKRELKRRSTIEPVTGHARDDGRLGRNDLLAAASHNLRLVLTRLEHSLVRFIGAVARMMAKGRQISSAGDPGPVPPNIDLPLPALPASKA